MKAEEINYLDELKREVFYDVVTGFINLKDIEPIMSGAEEYLHLRSAASASIKVWKRRLLKLCGPIYFLFKRGILMINGKAITSEQLMEEFSERDYISDAGITQAVFLSLLLQKPLLIEGEPGVGKTEIAKVLASVLDSELIRLQCYEGLDESKALYEWNYQKQLLYIQGQERNVDDVFSEEFLMVRPLLKAILAKDKSPVLLIDEIDKADEEFEAFLLEILSDFQISVPEFGTIKARSIPHIVITNNDARELTNALKRRCIYLHIDYPSVEKERDILLKKIPSIKAPLAEQIALLMNKLRSKADLLKKPSIAEGIDFARAITMQGIEKLDGDAIDRFLPTVIKNKEDVAMMQERGGGKWIGEI